jgi:hypothetical protein
MVLTLSREARQAIESVFWAFRVAVGDRAQQLRDGKAAKWGVQFRRSLRANMNHYNMPYKLFCLLISISGSTRLGTEAAR